MFGFRWDQGGPWSSTGVLGLQRFLERVWTLVLESTSPPAGAPAQDDARVRELRRRQHQTVRRVTQDMQTFSFNTVVSALMEYSNYLIALAKRRRASAHAGETPVTGTPAWDEAVDSLLLLMAPVFPHISEELWARRGRPYSIHTQPWPAWDEALAAEEIITIVVQVNGKVRDRFDAPADVGEEEAKARALQAEGVKKYLGDKPPAKVIYVPGRLVNIVAR
jgi:leucyl-tRNA synthetase